MALHRAARARQCLALAVSGVTGQSRRQDALHRTGLTEPDPGTQRAASLFEKRVFLSAQKCGSAPLTSDQSVSGWQAWATGQSAELAALSRLETLLVFAAV